jgi:hypothetical protein
VSEKPAPPLPKTLWSPLGPIRVRTLKRIKPLSKEVPRDIDDFGQYDPKKRTIRILRDLDPWVQWQTLRHEWVHAVIFDQGFHQAFTEEQIEAVCDLIGTALVSEMRNSS